MLSNQTYASSIVIEIHKTVLSLEMETSSNRFDFVQVFSQSSVFIYCIYPTARASRSHGQNMMVKRGMILVPDPDPIQDALKR
jgi:hypothetical protein